MIIFRIIFIIFIVLKFRLDDFFKLRKNSLLSILLYPLSLIKPKKNNRAIRLRLALESLGPIFIKFGQMLSTRKDLLPNDIAIELSKLQDKVPPFEFKRVKQVIDLVLIEYASQIQRRLHLVSISYRLTKFYIKYLQLNEVI